LRQGQSERSNLINARIKREEITRKTAEDKANNEFRNLQKTYMIKNQADMNKFRLDQAETNKDKVRNAALYNATRLLTAHMPRIQSITDPEQNEAERAAVRNAVGSVLSTSGHFKPDEIQGITQSWLPSIGTAVKGSMKTVNRLGDIDPTKTKDINYADALKQFGGLKPGRNIIPGAGPDGAPMAQDIDVTARDPYQVAMSGQGNMIDKGLNTAPSSFNQIGIPGFNPNDITGFKGWLQGTDARSNNDFQGAARPEQRFDATTTPRQVFQEQIPVTARTGLGDVDQAKVDFSNANTASLKTKLDMAVKAFPLEMEKIKAYITNTYDMMNDRKIDNVFKEKELNFRVHQLQVQSDLTRASQAIGMINAKIAQGRLNVSQANLELAKLMRPEELAGNIDRTVTIAKQNLAEKEKTYGSKPNQKQSNEITALRAQINAMDQTTAHLRRFSRQSTMDPKAWQDIAKVVTDFASQNNKLPDGRLLFDPKTQQNFDPETRRRMIGEAIDARGRALPFMPQNSMYTDGYDLLPGHFGPAMAPDFDYGDSPGFGQMDFFGTSQLAPTAGAYDPRYDDMGRTF
jgi:hypothetical protein